MRKKTPKPKVQITKVQNESDVVAEVGTRKHSYVVPANGAVEVELKLTKTNQIAVTQFGKDTQIWVRPDFTCSRIMSGGLYINGVSKFEKARKEPRVMTISPAGKLSLA